MSIKTKLTIGIFSIALVILILNTWMFYSYSKTGLHADWNGRMLQQTKDIADTTETIQQASARTETLVADMLKISLLAAEKNLGPDYRALSAEQLESLRRQDDISILSVYVLTDGQLRIGASTETKEAGLAVPETRPESAIIRRYLADNGQGIVLDSIFWTNRLDYSVSDPNVLEKRGFYYVKGSNYVLCGSLTAHDSDGLDGKTDMKRIMDKMKSENADIVGLTVFNPDSLTGEELPAGDQSGIPYWKRPIMYGSGKQADVSSDPAFVAKALQSDGVVSTEPGKSGDRSLFRYFYRPYGSIPMVIVLTAADSSVQSQLRHNLLVHLRVSLLILLGVVVAGYLLAGQIIRPLRTILVKVNQIAVGEFGSPIVLQRRDEFGILAAHVNRMSSNLENHTNQLEQTVEELRSTKEYLESFVGNTSDAIHVVDSSGRLLLVNEAFELLYGYNRAELGRLRLSIVPGLPEEEEDKLVGKVLQGGQVSGYETEGTGQSGEPIHVSVSVSPIRDGKGNVTAYATITRNMTERRQTEELLRRSEKLSIVGQLAAGVAHEIRNPLTTLRGFVQLQQKMNSGNPRHLELMLSELDRINFIVSEFLILAKPQATHFTFHDPRRILQEILVLLESQANMNNIEFQTEFDEVVPDLLCESNQLKQVFVNLMKNAIEAMPEGGTVRIELRNHDAKQVLIRIIDEGCGMPEEQLGKLGEPFYTNKENGTGLGLMVCQQIVNGHKGNMLIRSKLGAGTTVEIILPGQ